MMSLTYTFPTSSHSLTQSPTSSHPISIHFLTHQLHTSSHPISTHLLTIITMQALSSTLSTHLTTILSTHLTTILSTHHLTTITIHPLTYLLSPYLLTTITMHPLTYSLHTPYNHSLHTPYTPSPCRHYHRRYLLATMQHAGGRDPLPRSHSTGKRQICEESRGRLGGHR